MSANGGAGVPESKHSDYPTEPVTSIEAPLPPETNEHIRPSAEPAITHRPTEAEVAAAMDAVFNDRYPGMSKRQAVVSVLIAIGAGMGIYNMAAEVKPTTFATNMQTRGNTLVLGFKNILNITEFKAAGNSKMSTTRRRAEMITHSTFSATYLAQFIALFKLSKGETLIGIGTKTAGASQAVAAVAPAVLAAAMLTAAAFHFYSAYRADHKSKPLNLIEDRLQKLLVIINNPKVKNRELQAERMIHQIGALQKEFSDAASKVSVPPEIAKVIGQLSDLSAAISNKLSQHLIRKQHIKRKISLLKAKVTTAVGLGATSLTVGISVGAASSILPPVGMAVLSSAAAFGVYKSVKGYQHNKAKNRILTWLTKNLAETDPSGAVANAQQNIIDAQKAVSDLEENIETIRGSGFSRVRSRFSMSHSERNEVAHLKSQLKESKKHLISTQKSLENIVKHAIAREALELEPTENVLAYISPNDVNFIVNQYVNANKDLAFALEVFENKSKYPTHQAQAGEVYHTWAHKVGHTIAEKVNVDISNQVAPLMGSVIKAEAKAMDPDLISVAATDSETSIRHQATSTVPFLDAVDGSKPGPGPRPEPATGTPPTASPQG